MADKKPPQPKSLESALCDAQGEFPPIAKTKIAKVKGKTKTGSVYEYTFKYASYTDITKAVTPVLSKLGISFRHTIEQREELEGLFLVTSLVYLDGTTIDSYVPIPPALFADPQKLGSFMTYMKRYQLSGLCGVAADEDVDANDLASEGEGFEISSAKRKTTAKAALMDVTLVTAADVEALRKLMKDTDTDEAQYCKFLKVDSLDKLPLSKVAGANEALLDKQKKQAEKASTGPMTPAKELLKSMKGEKNET